MDPAALVFDFNGTLSDDEPLLCSIYQELFAAEGRPLAERQYYDLLAGLSDPEIVMTWLGRRHPAVADVIERRVELYLARAADGSTIPPRVREAVRLGASRVPLVVVSGAMRAEIESGLRGAGLLDCFTAIVSAEDVADDGKPHPAGYLLALERLGGPDPGRVVVFEDSEAGIAAAQAAGMRCLAVAGTLPPERLAAAERVLPGLDRAAVAALFA